MMRRKRPAVTLSKIGQSRLRPWAGFIGWSLAKGVWGAIFVVLLVADFMWGFCLGVRDGAREMRSALAQRRAGPGARPLPDLPPPPKSRLAQNRARTGAIGRGLLPLRPPDH